MIVTLDASVWLAAISPREHEQQSCATLVQALLDRRVVLHQPVLFVIEVCATIARRTGDRELAMAAAESALSFPHLQLYELNHRLAADAAEVASTCALRGADAIYVATARAAGATLITLDKEVRARASGTIAVRSAREFIAS